MPLLLIVAAVYRFPCDDLRGSFTLLVGAASSVGFAAYLWRINPWWGMFVGASSLSLIFPHYTQLSYITHRDIIFGFIWVLLVYKYDSKQMINAIRIIALCNVAFLICQHFYVDPLYHTNRPVGLMANRNEVSALLGISLAAFFDGRWKWLIPTILVGIVFTKSMGGWACVTAITVGYIYLKAGTKESICAALYIILAAVIACYFSDISNGRFEIWSAGIKYLGEHWLFGIGIGHWKVAFSEPIFFTEYTSGFRASMAHNEFLQGFVEIGIIFPIIISCYVISVLRKSKEIISTLAMFSIIASCFVHFLFHIGTTAYIALTWIAVWQREHDQATS